MRRISIIVATLALLAPAADAGAQNRVSTSGKRIVVEIPVASDLAEPLARGARRIVAAAGRERLHGCLGFELRVSPADDGHEVIAIPQRAGQFVRSVRDTTDPFRGTRTIMVGSRALEGAGAEGVVSALLLAGAQDATGDALARAGLVSAAGRAGANPRCRYEGTADITVTYAPFNLEVVTSLSFSFSVRPGGQIEGRVEPTTRSASSTRGEVGSCSASSAPMIPIRLAGFSDGQVLNLTFRPQGREPTIEMSCSGGTSSVSGGYITDFLVRASDVSIPARNGGSTREETSRSQTDTPGTGTFRVRLLR